MTDVSETGIWIDQASGQVVTDPPERGVQLVAPGGVIDDGAARAIGAARAAAPDDVPKRAPKQQATRRKAAEKRG